MKRFTPSLVAEYFLSYDLTGSAKSNPQAASEHINRTMMRAVKPKTEALKSFPQELGQAFSEEVTRPGPPSYQVK